ncbi:hypothetical protein ACLOJK_033281 [Asimina triloba]
MHDTAMEEALIRILNPRHSIDILRDVAYWLLQHDIKVMMAACDTFRYGAVEQLAPVYMQFK